MTHRRIHVTRGVPAARVAVLVAAAPVAAAPLTPQQRKGASHDAGPARGGEGAAGSPLHPWRDCLVRAEDGGR